MSFYSQLSADQVSSTYSLIMLLRLLRVIGTLDAYTEESEEVWHSIATRCTYNLVKVGYLPKSTIDWSTLILQRMHWFRPR